MPKVKYALHSSDNCFGLTKKLDSIKKEIGGSLGKWVTSVNQFQKH